MALQKTKVLNITSVTGIATVGILTAGVTPTDAGVAGTCYIRSVIMHNTGLGTARVSLYINPDTNPVSIAVTTNRILRVDVAPNETTFFESNYPVVLTSTDSLGVEVGAPDVGGVGIGSAVNFLVNGDTDI
tara:strand:- start:177 stop:569 length:393 start_codon:yes stop_codon:yes gene_type:complete